MAWILQIHCKFLENDPQKLGKLDNIYQNPSYYAGYYLRNIEGNLWLLGSVTAEQNHASIVAYMGEGGNWSIMLHMSMLMSRHQDHVKKRKQKKIFYMLGHININLNFRGRQELMIAMLKVLYHHMHIKSYF